jgi:ABC-type transport system involved in multi-copper enzyme maturation permease subunit
MNAKGTRMLKEVRALFWPWCAVMIAGVLGAVEQAHPALTGGGGIWGVHQLIEPISFLGFFLGIPLLATLALGNEFQHRTVGLLLSQPVGRMEIWGEKMSVTLVAVVSAALVYWYGWRSALQEDPEICVFGGTLIIAMVASATFWTLFARSMMGGLALNCVNSFIPLTFSIRRDLIPETTMARSIAGFVLLCYAGVMLWLGRRALSRFQVTGGIAGEDLLVSGPEVMPAAVAGWFRSRPTGAVLNLVRKEFRLLRPVWVIGLLGLLGWISLPMFGYRIEHGPLPAFIAAMMVMAFTPLIAVLAGSMSLGEERSSGTHVWQLTQPVTAGKLWFIKLVMAMFTGLVCAVVLPALTVIAGGWIFKSPVKLVVPERVIAGAVWVSLLIFASFWCACAVNGTVRAVLWVFPGIVALALSGGFGAWLAPKVVALSVLKVELFANFRFTNAVSNLELPGTGVSPIWVVLHLLVPMLLLAVMQSYWLFRRQLQDSTMFVIRNLLPLAIVTFLSMFFWMAFHASVVQAKQQMWSMFKETHEAIEKIQPGTANLDEAHPLQLTVEDMVKVAPLSERTQRWLRNSRISVAPDKPHLDDRYCCRGNSRSITFASERAYSRYLATVQLPSGSKCAVSFQAGRGYGTLGGVCE